MGPATSITVDLGLSDGTSAKISSKTASWYSWKIWGSEADTAPHIISAQLSVLTNTYNSTVPANLDFKWSIIQVIFALNQPSSVFPIINNKIMTPNIPVDCALTVEPTEPEVEGTFEVYFTYNPWYNLDLLWVAEQTDPIPIGRVHYVPSEKTEDEYLHQPVRIVILNALSPIGWGGKYFVLVFQPDDPAFAREVALITHDHRDYHCDPTGAIPSLLGDNSMTTTTCIGTCQNVDASSTKLTYLAFAVTISWLGLFWCCYLHRGALHAGLSSSPLAQKDKHFKRDNKSNTRVEFMSTPGGQYGAAEELDSLVGGLSAHRLSDHRCKDCEGDLYIKDSSKPHASTAFRPPCSSQPHLRIDKGTEPRVWVEKII
jgi:hypothetical protein